MKNSEYIILIEPSSSFSIDDIDIILQTSSSKYSDMISEYNVLIQDLEKYPDREVTASFQSSFKKIGIYYLDEFEVEKLLKLPYIKSITPNDFPEETHLDLYDKSFTDTDNLKDAPEGVINANYRAAYGSTNSSTYIDPSINTNEIGNWALYYHSLPPESIYSGSLGKKSSQLIKGISYSQIPQKDYTNYDNFNFPVNGKNVDFIINEGNSSPYSQGTKTNSSAMDFNHPDFYGYDGNTRIKFIDWKDYGWPYYANDCFYPYSKQWKTGYVSSTAHKQMVASSAVGLYNGYASGANIYFIPGGASNVAGWNTILNFHLNKPINPETGRKNPTIVNCSQGTGYQYPYYQYELGGKSSGSFDFSDQGYNKGFRISHYGKDYIFVSSSTTSVEENLQINNHNGYFSQNPSNGVANIYYYNSPNLNDLISIFNREISSYFIANLESDNLISITQSTDYRVINPKIYTGSLEDFIEVPGKLPPKGGYLATELSGGFEPNTHISRIVVKNEEVFSGSNGFINSNHGYTELPPYDWYGIDKGINWVGNPLEDTIATRVDPEYTGSGVTFNTVRLYNKTNGGDGLSIYNALRQVYYELAQNGVIVVTSAGNNPSYATHTSSSLEENEFYDPDLFDNDLYNTYIEIDCEMSYTSVVQSLGRDTPLRFFTPSIVNNYTIINAGMLDYYPGNYIINTNNITNTPSTQIYDILSCATTTIRGKGVEAYMASSDCVMAGYQSNINSLDFVTYTCSFYQNSNIPFNTKSLMDQYTQSFMSFEYYENEYNFTTETDDAGNIPFDINGPLVNSVGGGTSNASPRLAGMIACYLQLYPDANLNDVRKWIKSIGVPIDSNYSSERKNYLYFNGFQTSSDPERPFEMVNEIVTRGYDLGPNPIIPRFPFNKPNPIELTGSINISGINFSL